MGMTKPFMQTGISILLRKDISEGAGFFHFLSPFAPETWIGILIAYMATAASIFIAARLIKLPGQGGMVSLISETFKIFVKNDFFPPYIQSKPM